MLSAVGVRWMLRSRRICDDQLIVDDRNFLRCLCRGFVVGRRDRSTRAHHGEVAKGPLYGYRILDLTRVLAGPLCTMILGDMGAEVIKIEKPGYGDETRKWGPPFVGSETCYFLSVNRSKKSVAVDISHQAGADVIRELAKVSDVFIENFLPGNLDKYGLSYDDLKTIKPDLVYCSISGYGQDGPYKQRGGYDVIASALGGMMHITGTEDGDPCKIGTAMTDISTGLYAHGAIIAALLQREKTGKGARIDCNLLSTQVANLVNLGGNFLNAGIEPKRWGTAHESIVPYQAFRTRDERFLVVGAGSDKQFQQLNKLMSMQLDTLEKFATNSTRVKNRKELIAILSAEFARKSLDEWLDLFRTATFPFGAVNNFAQVFSDPQVQHNDMVFEMVHNNAGKIRVVHSPVKMSGFAMNPQLPPPMLGEHTDEVLCDILGYEKRDLDNMRRNKIIQ